MENPIDFKNITIAEYKTQFFETTPHTLVDVRTVEEFRQGRIPGALNIPLDDLEARVNEIPNDLPIVVVCAHGMRSIYGSEFIRYSGFENVHNLEGGTVAWQIHRLPLDR